MNTRIEDRLNDLASRQHGLATRGQLLEAGVTRDEVAGLLARGRLRRVHAGVYLTAPSLSPPGRALAGVLACGPAAMASHETAGWLREWVPRPARNRPVDVTVPGGNRRRRPGIRVHRSGLLSPGDAQLALGVPTTPPLPTLLALATRVDAGTLERAVACAERESAVSLAAIEGFLDRCRGRPGAPALRAVVALPGGPAFTRSKAEALFLEGLRLRRLPSPRVNAVVDGYEVDFYWPDADLGVEIDGWRYHRWRDRFEGDRSRGTRLAATGIHILRFTYRRLVDEPEIVFKEVAQALAVATARRRGELGRSQTAG